MLPDAAIGPLLAAIVAALVALLSLIISKENKTSEFRQQWIDALRDDISWLVGHMTAMQGTVRISGRTPEAWREARADVIGANQRIASIRLRLNPNEDQCKKIITTLDEMMELFVREGELPEKRINDLEKSLVRESQVFLKSEWRRVRNGEL